MMALSTALTGGVMVAVSEGGLEGGWGEVLDGGLELVWLVVAVLLLLPSGISEERGEDELEELRVLVASGLGF